MFDKNKIPVFKTPFSLTVSSKTDKYFFNLITTSFDENRPYK